MKVAQNDTDTPHLDRLAEFVDGGENRASARSIYLPRRNSSSGKSGY